MKFIHTGDWHLGHKLHDVDRRQEHEAFLDWLVRTIGRREVDALLICGDVFDAANPSAEAQETWYRFLARCRREQPAVDIIVIGGNHDSSARLDAPNPLLRELGVHIVGGLPRRGGEVSLERVLNPVTDRDGTIAAWVAAVPFLRPPDLPAVEGDDPLVEGVSQLYRRILGAAAERAAGQCPVVAMGHLYLSGTRISELSERKVLGGNQHALPVEMFPEEVAYVALGHLHLEQVVGRENVRYAGAPLPLSIPERRYTHRIVEVELNRDGWVGCELIAVPRAREVLRIPDEGAAPVTELIAALAALPAASGGEAEPPLLEVAARLDRPEPGLRHDVEQVLEDRHARLVALTVEVTGHGKPLADHQAFDGLADVLPEQVFQLAWERHFDGDPPTEMVAAFHELIEQVMQGNGR